VTTRSSSRWGGVLALLLTLLAAPSVMLAAPGDAVPTPSLVSGRSLSDPESLLPADVLARVELVRANVELLRRFMGKPSAPAALLRVEGAQPHECESQARNLRVRANRLAFEQLRISRREPVPKTGMTRPADMFGTIDDALEAVLLVKQEFGIGTAVAEELRPETTTASEVFNATVAAGNEINNLLREGTSPTDVFQLVTEAVHIATTLHTAVPNGPDLPPEPTFEPDKTPEEVYLLMQSCLALVRELDRMASEEMLEFELSRDSVTRATPNDSGDLAALIVEELATLHARSANAKKPARAHYSGERFPAHTYQRSRYLKMILSDLAAANAGAMTKSPAGE
jgi:hypothetical protein